MRYTISKITVHPLNAIFLKLKLNILSFLI